MDLGFTLFTIGFFLLVGGVLYAILIYLWSLDRTYWEVVFGVGFTIAGEIVAIIFTLKHYGVLPELWWIILFSPVAFALTGLPMIVFQEIKHWQQKRKAADAERKHNGDD